MKKSRSMSPLRRTTETNKVDVSQQSGHKCINQYVILKTIGKGSFAKVKLAEDSSNGELVVDLVSLLPSYPHRPGMTGYKSDEQGSLEASEDFLSSRLH